MYVVSLTVVSSASFLMNRRRISLAVGLVGCLASSSPVLRSLMVFSLSAFCASSTRPRTMCAPMRTILSTGSSSSKLMKPTPFLRSVSRWKSCSTSVTVPNWPKYSFRSSSDTLLSSPPVPLLNVKLPGFPMKIFLQERLSVILSSTRLAL